MSKIPKNATTNVRTFIKEMNWIEMNPKSTAPRMLLVVRTRLMVDCLKPIASDKSSSPIILIKIGVSIAPEK